MKWIHGAGIAASLFVTLLLTGCGDVYRPVVDPFQNPGADPQTSTTAFVLSQGVTESPSCANPPCQGSVSQIDVPGDVNMGVKDVGVTPWHIYATTTSAYIANRDSGNVSYYSPFFGASAPVTTISLPAGTQPTYVNTTQTDAVYVALRSTGGGPGSLGVITTNQLSQTVPVGIEPVALVETPDKTKVYVVNKNGNGSGVGTVTVIAALDKKVLSTITVGVAPVYAIATPDSKYVFVLNRGGNSVSVISTATNQNLGNIPVGSSADVTDIPLNNPMYFDSRQQRLYVVNSNDGTLSVFDTSTLPAIPAPVPASPLSIGQGSKPVSLAALPDGSRVYVADQASGNVAVINARSLTVMKTIPAGVTSAGNGTLGIAASGDGTKVYAINRAPSVVEVSDPANPGATIPYVAQQAGTAVIKTSDDTVATLIPAPFQDPVACTIDTPQTWIPSFRYDVGATVVPSTANGHVYIATKLANSGGAEPAWCTTAGCTVTDGAANNPNAQIWKEAGTPPTTACPRQSPVFVTMGK